MDSFISLGSARRRDGFAVNRKNTGYKFHWKNITLLGEFTFLVD